MSEFTLSPEDPLVEKLHEWNVKHEGGTTYQIVAQEEGKDVTVKSYKNRPCNGEMRPYAKTHPDEVKDGVRMPSDLSIKFPDGNPIAIGLAGLGYNANGAEAEFTEFLMLHHESPYRCVFPEGSVQIRKDDRGRINSIVLLNTKVDATALLHAIINRRRFSFQRWVMLKQKFGGLLATMICLTSHPNGYGSDELANNFGYTLHGAVSIPRLVKADPLKLSHNADNFFDRGVYNRPDLSYVWHEDAKVRRNEITEFLDKKPSVEAYANFLDEQINKV